MRILKLPEESVTPKMYRQSAKYCDERVCMSACLSVCLYVCSLACLKDHMSKLYEISFTCYSWPWLDPHLTTSEYVMYFWFCVWRHVFHNRPYGMWHWQCLLELCSHRFSTYSPGGATMFEFVMVYNGSKLRTRGVWDDDMRGAANSWWPL